MRVPIRATLGMCVGALTLVGCMSLVDNKGQSTTADTEAGQQSLAEQLQRYYQEDLARSPVSASYQGVKLGYDQWNDISEAAEAAELEIQQQRLQELLALEADALTAQERNSLAIAKLNVQRLIDFYPFRNNDYIMQQFRSWHTSVPSILINVHRVTSEQDLKDYIARIENTESLFEQVMTKMAIQAQQGVYAPEWSYPQMLEASANVISGYPFSTAEGSDNPIYADFKAKVTALSLDDAVTDAYLEQAKTALVEKLKPAYEQLIEALKTYADAAPDGDGVWRLPNGKAYYDYLLKFYTTTDLNAEQIHQLGLQNVASIHQQMRAIMAKVGFDGSLQDFFVFMREDPQFYYPNTDEGKERYLSEAVAVIDTIREDLDGYFGIQPKAPLKVKRVEAFREKSAGKAFYQRPPPDGSRPGVYYVNLYDMKSMPTYQMEALAYHEGVPGHHLQLAINAELAGVSDYQKNVRFTAYTEGWGLYSEYLPKEMGYYQDPYSDFGRLAMELWRACRLVVDTGIHDKRWSREQAIDYLTTNTPNPIRDAEKAIERYIVYPGQATAYLVGKIKILELREQARSAMGDAFSMAEFHDLVLQDGPMPLSMLETKITQWIETNKES